MDSDELAEQIGKQVRKLREGQDMNQDEVAEESGYSTSAISKIENGNYDLNLDGLERVMNAVGQEIDDIQFRSLNDDQDSDE